MATNYSLGNDVLNYQTAAHTQFANPQSQPQREQPRFKNYNQRIDVISGQKFDHNHRSGAGFEAFTENKQHMKSYNQTKFVPADLYIEDPITGRRLIRVSYQIKSP